MSKQYRFVNLWKYWHETHDFTLIAIDFHDGMINGCRFIICNVGFIRMSMS